MKTFFVYIMTNRWHTVRYTGVTAHLGARGIQHKYKLIEGFTKRYGVTKMVFARHYPTAWEAISAEKKIKSWARQKKIVLIESVNPEWKDVLTEDGAVNLDILRDRGFGNQVTTIER